jgi:hypothetical protein
MSLFSQIKNSVNSILPTLYNDPDLTTIVTWKVFKDSVFNESLGVNEDTYTDHTGISAIRVEKEIGASKFGGNNTGSLASQFGVGSGDTVYLFKFGDVPTEASIRDTIVESNGMKYSVKKIYPVFGLIVKVEVKGYA